LSALNLKAKGGHRARIVSKASALNVRAAENVDSVVAKEMKSVAIATAKVAWKRSENDQQVPEA